MAANVEYPDLPFSVPAAFGSGRDGKSVMYVVIHYTAGAEGRTSAEDGAAYDQRRTDGVSTHYFHDPDSTIQEVLTTNRANAALYKGNRLGIQHELCGTLQTRAQWLDAASDAILWRTAKQVARDCAKYQLPVRRLTVSQTRDAWYLWPNGPRGIVGHVDVTRAYPEDGGTHTDPGADFPWDVLLDRVQHFVNGGIAPMALDGIDKAQLNNAEHYLQSLVGMTDAAAGISDTVRWDLVIPNRLTAAVRDLLGQVQALRDGQAKLETLLRELHGAVAAITGVEETTGGGLTEQQVEDAAFRGAQRAEDA